MNFVDSEIMETIPEEYQDVLLSELAYDPVRLPMEEDPNQVLYDRKTLEKIWEMSLYPRNPLTRRPLNIDHVIPQKDLLKEMREFVAKAAPGMASELLVQNYDEALSAQEMRDMFNDLQMYYEQISKDPSKVTLRAIFRIVNRLRLCCQYNNENKDLFKRLKGSPFVLEAGEKEVFSVLASIDFSERTQLYKEIVYLVDVIGVSAIQFSRDKTVEGVMMMMTEAAVEAYVRVQSMTLKVMRKIFQKYKDGLPKIWLPTFVSIAALCLLIRDEISSISNRDFYNGFYLLSKCRILNQDQAIICRLKEFHNFVSHKYCRVLARSYAILLCRLKEFHKPGNSAESKEMLKAEKAMEMVVELIYEVFSSEEDFCKAYKEGLLSNDIVKDIINMIDMAVEGVEISEKAMRYGLHTVLKVYSGKSPKIKSEHVASFAAFLGSSVLSKYGAALKNSAEIILNHAAMHGVHA